MSETNETEKNIFCPDCKNKTWDKWCQNCNSKRLKQDFSKWTSGNELIDKFIREAQLKAKNHLEVIEWIPYNRLRNIQYLDEGGFSTIYKAILLDGFINKWDEKNQQWKRYSNDIKDKDYEDAKKGGITSPLNENEKHGHTVVLKSLNNSSNINDDFLNEWRNYMIYIYSEDHYKLLSIKLYGITQDPETLNYMIVMEHMEFGSLRTNLMVKKCNPVDKYYNLYYITQSLSALHNSKLVHGDLHSGNILLSNNMIAHISDFGLSKPVGKLTKSNEVYGVLPYIAPEVLRRKSYTKAADIYSLEICRGKRPEIKEVRKVFDDIENQKKFECLEKEYMELMIRCWDSDPDKRPTAAELHKHFREWYGAIIIPKTSLPDDEVIIRNHPLSCYKSRKFDYISVSENLDLEDCRIPQ
ncbi:kinase-like domain-containing protein [Rhizophagus clarus]|uniref:Kinase-like domain-containing protein n=1 Tax=Rhizophagus clarus TaxID=94130 RepID=A0A8H3L963_9GLOM|nr:kinase-like domain-containing protein [Rhizophagus clarus]